ncbi:MAG: putative actin, alpha skeletal muscle [Streblomastix strix]|uniref:Putative actin, alpha skeletal muscle n=1 Tax=Streblomastix strix TaxID=222440 RepID=A0A5J4XA89_9EUKA|nr:MAG: putative actin, alpha skeletal muscle [Streblomastix strix]
MFIAILLLGAFVRCSSIIELDTSSFKNDVLGSDNTYFVMFHTTHCPACLQMMPEFKELASDMRSIGIRVGTVDLDRYPVFSRTYNAYSIPKLMLFRPNKEPLEYQSYRTAKEMGDFILDKQMGAKHIRVLGKPEKLDAFFNTSAKLPRVLLFSKKSTLPPMYKQICFMHRKEFACGFISKTHPTIPEIASKLVELGPFDINSISYPSIFIVDYQGAPVLDRFADKLSFSSLDKGLGKLIRQNRNRQSSSKAPMIKQRFNTPVVIDNGSQLTKAGFGGDKQPQSVFPTIFGNSRARYTFNRVLKITPDDRSILLSEVPQTSTVDREKTSEIMFEKLKIGFMNIQNTGLLTLYASGKTTGTVLVIGGGLSSVVPIYNSVKQNDGIMKQDYAGKEITEQLMSILTERGLQFRTTTERLSTCNLKENQCYIAFDYQNEIKQDPKLIEQQYEMPDGNSLQQIKKESNYWKHCFNQILLD